MRTFAPPTPMQVWLEFLQPPSSREVDLTEAVLKAWFMVGKLGGYNSQNLQVGSETQTVFFFKGDLAKAVLKAWFMTAGRTCRSAVRPRLLHWMLALGCDELSLPQATSVIVPQGIQLARTTSCSFKCCFLYCNSLILAVQVWPQHIISTSATPVWWLLTRELAFPTCALACFP
ncbi:hypothetical protein DUNSADRAFT_10283 [Dunaliella salina]|uniref:LAGLIDADG homing endonuclease n=1 Tax=Dunaliella salina TaxID=3046 RepID=A0ABQ7GFM6_DUNSA|nr:hypothetical protein DUNSADRAFT_10283 [Dunaliella salina]|eukprot:KAF5833414.1 hypothetical protein DUNSADRAFT_10283 [Dunaliella salina]